MINKVINNLGTYTKHNLSYNIFWGTILIILIIIIYSMIYITGGYISSLMHLSYIPIFLSVFLFNTTVGIITSIAVGIAVGPFMPSILEQHLNQNPSNWIFRIIMFIIIAIVFGLLVSHIRKTNEIDKRKAFEDINTGYPNTNKLREDLTNMITQNNHNNFSIVIFEYKNLEMISKYIDYETGQESFIELLKMAHDFFRPFQIYLINYNKFLVILPNYNKDESYYYSSDFLTITKEPIIIKELPISTILKSGILQYPLHCNNIKDIFLKIEKVMDQANKTQNDIVIYNHDLFKEDNNYYNTLITLYDALKNNEFSLVYQPKINITTNEVIGVEALLRLNKLSEKDLSIEQFIKMAEDAGFIKDVSKWVLNYAIQELKNFKENDLKIKISVNLSSMDLIDETFFLYAKDKIKLYDIDPDLVEFELTERIIIEDEEKVFKLLKKIKDFGIKISLDDYGAGYNSLKYILNYADTFDYMKIDKSFVDNIFDDKNKLILKYMIDIARGLGIEVIAEGVEEQSQVEILKSIGCNIVQGYYFSKPLNSEDLKQFINKGLNL
ncbi:MAG: EAL domain-containing protein [Tissierellia bacterium]|nr:EAL domain-containing protein [Tissierellia bacterium]